MRHRLSHVIPVCLATMVLAAVSPMVARADDALARLIPPDKNLSPQWVASLYARGRPEVYSGKDLKWIGMPVGGIGCGQLYLGGDGHLWHWDIFNHFAGTNGDHYAHPMVPSSPLKQGFAVEVTTGGHTQVRQLAAGGFRDISFLGEYPMAFVTYRDPDSPVAVSLMAFSPFIPLDAEDSALPATVMQFTVRNVSQAPVKARLAGWLQNAVCLYSGPWLAGTRRNDVMRGKAMTFLACSAEPAAEAEGKTLPPGAELIAGFDGRTYGGWKAEGEAFGPRPAGGALAPEQHLSGYLGAGLVNSYYEGDAPTGKLTSPAFTIDRPYLSFLIGGGDHPGQTCVNLLVGGKVARTATGRNSDAMGWVSWDVRDLAGKRARLEIVDAATGGWGHIDVDEIMLTKALPVRVLADFDGETYDGWKAEGKAFGPGPARGKLPGQQNLGGWEGKGCVVSYHGYDEATGKLTSPDFTIDRPYINLLIGGGNHPGQTCVNLLVGGKVVRTATGDNTDVLKWATWNVRQLAGKQARIQIVDEATGGWGHVDADQIELSLSPRASGVPTGRLVDQSDYGTMGLALCGPTAGVWATAALPSGLTSARDAFAGASGSAGQRSATRPFGDELVGVLGRNLSLPPGREETVTFLVTWYFPHVSLGGPLTGRRYERRFAAARDVADYLSRNLASLSRQTCLWHDTWYDSTLPYWFLDRTMASADTLATSTVYWLGNGRFYGFEGVGCCAGTCTHVWSYAQAVARLFPSLERSEREKVDYGVAFDPKTGMIGYRGEGTGPAIDGQAGTILRTYREYEMSPDGAFLKRIWPRVRKSIEYLIALDGNNDGILEGPQPNTLDATWYGKISWISSLYLASLKAGEKMAMAVGDQAFARRARAIFDAGSRNIDQLFNGEYFIQTVDPAHPKAVGSYNGCEIDQVFGQSWAFQVGLGQIMDRQKVLSALRSLWRYNFTRDVGPYRAVHKPGRWFAMPGEGGLLMCTFPQGTPPALKASGAWSAMYFNECMTGFEYEVASHMIWEGMVKDGLAIVRTIHERYGPSKRNPWNEIECGDHYARAMAAYGAFIAACGFEYDGPRGYIAFSPRLTPDHFRAAFTSAQGWGTFRQERRDGVQREAIEVKWGSLRLRKLAFDVPAGGRAPKVAVWVAGRQVQCAHVAAAPSQTARGVRVNITLAADAHLGAGQAVVVELR